MIEQQTLFKESEVFTKIRPEKLPEAQVAEIYKKLAGEIILNQWSDSDIEDIIADLKTLSMYDSGYELAKDLEMYGKKGKYSIDTDFIEWLDNFDSPFYDAKMANIRLWVKAHDIKPKLTKGTKLEIKEFLSRDAKLKIGNTIFIVGIWEKDAQYIVYDKKDSTLGTAFNYEKIEQCCSVI